ncbi:histidine phosphatase family protein [Apilactobacillus kunkeei]|nr:histidine phosphatase family protein [Apilactobacillus kunkeei]MCK8633438.1 histidine phosphatase family protein [Apilactobacillus kunkeei]
MMINIYLVRHGQTYLNKYNRIQGIANAPLTEKGIADAINAGKRLSSITFNHAYSSDMPRAFDTGKYVLQQNPSDIEEPIADKAFREENFGYFEGNDSEAAWHQIGGPDGMDNYAKMISKLGMGGTADLIAAHDPYGDAENNQDLLNRFIPGLKKVIQNANDGDNIMIAAHGTIIRWAVDQFKDDSIDVSEPIENGSVSKLVSNADASEISVEYYNNLSENV